MITDTQYAAWLAADGKARELLLEAGCNHAGGEITRYLSRYGHTTEAAETPATTAYLARLTGSARLSRKISLGGGAPSVQIQTGNIGIDNTGGELDDWLNDVWEKRPVKVFIGDPSWARADFRQIFAGRAAALNPSGRGGLELVIFDEMGRLNFPVSEAKLGGTTQNKETLLPLCFGECYNVEPLLRDPTTGTYGEYQINNGAAELVIEVRDNGVPVSFTPALPTGRFILDQSPVGGITADVQGAKNAGGAYVCTLAGIIATIVTEYGDPATRLAGAEIDGANFAAFDAQNPGAVGLYLNGKTNVIEACNALAASAQASLYFGRDGKLRLWRPPVTIGAPAAAFAPGDMLEGTFRAVEIIPATPAVTLGWGRNWTVQAAGSLASLCPSAIDDLKLEYREIGVNDAAAVALRRYTATPAREDTLLVAEADASAEANARLAFCAAPHLIVEFDTYAGGYLRELGDVVALTHPRHGFASGKNGIIIGIDEDLGNNRVRLEVMT